MLKVSIFFKITCFLCDKCKKWQKQKRDKNVYNLCESLRKSSWSNKDVKNTLFIWRLRVTISVFGKEVQRKHVVELTINFNSRCLRILCEKSKVWRDKIIISLFCIYGYLSNFEVEKNNFWSQERPTMKFSWRLFWYWWICSGSKK